MDERLKPCPFCGGGETQFLRHTYWTGQRNEELSCEIKHWCSPLGFPRLYLSITGRNEQQAIDAWNTRA